MRKFVIAALAVACAALFYSKSSSQVFFIDNCGTCPCHVAPTASSTFIVAEGDSITQNHGATGVTSYPNLYAPNTSLVTLQNNGHSGDGVAGPVSRESSDIALISSNPGFSKYIYTILIGVNDSSNATYYPNNAAGLATAIGGVCDSVKSGGFTYAVVSTLTDFDSDQAHETWRATLNAAISALVPTHCDALIDYGSSASVGIPGISLFTNLFSDGTHPTNLGQTYMECMYAATINSLIAGAVTPGSVFNIQQGATKNISIALSWSFPSSGGYYSDYSIQYAVHGSGSWTSFSHTASRNPSVLLTGLSAATAYDVRIAPTGTLGQGPYIFKAMTATLTTLPDTLDNLTATPIFTLSNSNLTATSNPTGAIENVARSLIGKSTGKWYFEFLVAGTGAAYSYGICDDTQLQYMPLSFDLGTYANSVASGGTPNITGFTIANAVTITPGLGDRIMIAFDADAKKAWLGINNVWGASGNPATGANPWLTWSGSYTIYAALGLNYAGGSFTYSGASPFYSPPSGFSAL
jgi:hypothetical protein